MTKCECTCGTALTDENRFIHLDEEFCSFECAEASCFEGLNPEPVRKLP